MHQQERKPAPPKLAGLALLLALWQAGAAWAHSGLPETSSLTVRRGHPEQLFVGTTFGAVVSPGEGQGWRWVCPEALGTTVANPERYLWQEDGTLLAATFRSLVRSRDGGCTWLEHPFFAERWPVSLASHPAAPSRLWVVTGRPGEPNGLYRSEDGGDTFTATALQRGDSTFTAVEVAPGDARRLYVSGMGPSGPVLWRSGDGGDTWEEWPQPLPGVTRPGDFKLLRVSEADAERLWARVSTQGERLLLESRDGGRTWQVTLAPEGFLVGMEASADGRTVWLATLNRLWRWREGQAPTLLALPDGNTCAQRVGEHLYACGASWVHGWALARSRDEGDTWEPLLSLSQVQGVLECPVGTPTRDRCGPLWPQMAQLLGAAQTPDAGTPGEPPTAPPPAKGCSSAAGAEPVGGLALLALLRRGRRRRQRNRAQPSQTEEVT